MTLCTTDIFLIIVSEDSKSNIYTFGREEPHVGSNWSANQWKTFSTMIKIDDVCSSHGVTILSSRFAIGNLLNCSLIC